MNCNCVEEANKALAEHNTEIKTIMVRDEKLVRGKRQVQLRTNIAIPTGKRDSRDKRSPIVVGATFCPLCGKRTAGRSKKATCQRIS